MPFFRSLVEMAAIARAPRVQDFGARVQGAAPVGGDDDGVLDADAAVPGEVHAGLDGDDVAGGERSSRRSRATRGASWISRPTPWPVPCTNASPQPAVVDDVAARRVDVRARRRPAAHRGTPGRLALEHDVEHPALASAPGSPTHDRAGHVGAVAVDEAPKSMHHELARARCGAIAGRWWGLAPFGPDADDRLEAGAVGAPAGASRCRARARTPPRWARRPAGARRAASASSAMRAARPRCGRPRRRPSPGAAPRPGPRSATSSAPGNHSSA